MTDHSFGGNWTEIKLSIIETYLSIYTTALKNQVFDLHYIDAFAGTGERQQVIKEAPLLKEPETTITYDGSVKKALKVEPPFKNYHFIEANHKRFKQLEKITSQYSDRKINLYPEDANLAIPKIINQSMNRKSRAALFLDPYGLSVDWETLQYIQASKRIDAWFLFSLSGLYRNASIEFDEVEDYKIQKLNRVLGTDEWQKCFYSDESANEEKGQTSFDFGLKDEPQNTTKTRTANVTDLENYVFKRLNSIFPYVHKPVALPGRNSGRAQMYSFFLCVSNPNKNAWGLAAKFGSAVTRKFE